MTQADRDRLVTLKKAKKKLITQRAAAEELGLSTRQVKRLLYGLKKQGDKAVIHGLRGKPSKRRIEEAIEREAFARHDAGSFDVVAGGEDRPADLADLARDERGVGLAEEPERDVGLAAHEIERGAAHDELDLERRIVVPEWDEPPHEEDRHRLRRREPDDSLGPLAIAPDPPDELVEATFHRLGEVGRRETCLVEDQALRRPRRELRTERRLERAKAATRGRRLDLQLAGGGAQRSRAAQREEKPQIIPV